MNIYKGSNRRQVGAGLFSTISRGARPIILSLLAKLSPHFANITKSIGKRAAKAALNVGTDMASNLITGRLNKRKAKDIIDTELQDIKSDASNKLDEYKQRFTEQIGSGKRRRIQAPKNNKKKTKMPRRRKSINKRTAKKCKKGCVTKRKHQYKHKKGGPKRKARKVQKRRRRTRRVAPKDIFQ